MKTQSVQSTRLLQDRPLPETPHQTRRYTSLDLAGLDQTDFTDAALRAFLVVCLMVSMLVCGRQWSAMTTEAAACSAGTPVALVGTDPQPASHTLAPKALSTVRGIL